MPKLRHYWRWLVQGMLQSFLVGEKRALRPCPCLGTEYSLEPAGHTDGHTRSLRISLFTRRLTETILCVGTCDTSSSVLRVAIERPLDNLSGHSVYLMVYHGSSLSRPAWIQAMKERSHGAGQDRLAKDQDLLIKLVSLERTLKGIGCFDGGLI